MSSSTGDNLNISIVLEFLKNTYYIRLKPIVKTINNINKKCFIPYLPNRAIVFPNSNLQSLCFAVDKTSDIEYRFIVVDRKYHSYYLL